MQYKIIRQALIKTICKRHENVFDNICLSGASDRCLFEKTIGL